jgi:phenylalanyl-tRNA synthetase beta chain
MTISYQWLLSYLNTPVELEILTETLTAIGLEVEGCELRQQIKGGLQGVIIGQVLTREQHPDADRLSVTTVDIGAAEPLQIVCGAPNVAAGQKVVVATIGATIYPVAGEPLTMKKSKIRGIESFGMICAEDELGLGTSHAGILVLPETAKIGQAAADYFDLKDDYCIEIGLTPNRSDAQSHIGVAQDVAAALTAHGQAVTCVLPQNTLDFAAVTTEKNIDITVQNAAACPRYCGLVLANVTVAPSPAWLRERLDAVGVRSINNVVDVTNFVLHEYGQPLHSFDYDKINGAKLVIQNLPQGAKFTTLDGQSRELDAADLMICDGANNGLCMAGVFGGLHSGVTDATKTIFLEAAYFDAVTVRRTATRHNLRTDAARTFEKGIDPNGVLTALQRAAQLICELTGANIASQITDIYPKPIAKAEITVRYAQINRLIGNDFAPSVVKNILNALDIDIIAETAEGLTVQVPTNKPDVLREVDIIEEIIRIYGLDNIAIDTTVQSALTFGDKPDAYSLRNRIAEQLAAQGFCEMMGMSITQSRYFEANNYFENNSFANENLVFINNTANKGLDVLRPTLLFSALEAVLRNQNRQNADVRLFEFGKTYHKVYHENAENTYAENQVLSLAITGQKAAENWQNTQKTAVSYFTLKAHIEHCLQRVGAFANTQQTVLTDDARFVYGLRLHKGAQIIAEFGCLHPKLTKKMDIKQPVFYGEINWDAVLKAVRKHKTVFAELPKYPSVRRDLALILDAQIGYDKIELTAKKEAKKLLQSVNLFDVYENEQHIGAGKKSYSVSFVFQDPAATLKDGEIDATMQRLTAAFEKHLGAIIRR